MNGAVRGLPTPFNVEQHHHGYSQATQGLPVTAVELCTLLILLRMQYNGSQSLSTDTGKHHNAHLKMSQLWCAGS